MIRQPLNSPLSNHSSAVRNTIHLRVGDRERVLIKHEPKAVNESISQVNFEVAEQKMKKNAIGIIARGVVDQIQAQA